MIRTSLTDAFDLGCPILSAGFAFAARPPLAAAVSNAGGMGFLGADLVPAWTVVDMIQATRRRTTRPFGVAFVGAFVTDEQIQACVAVRPAVVAFFGPPPRQTWLDDLRDRDIDVWLHVISPAEALDTTRWDDVIGSLDLAAMLPTPNILGRTTTVAWPRGPHPEDQWETKPAAEIIREMSDEADIVLEALLSVVTRRESRSPR